MEPIFSTKQMHPRDKFDSWHSVACESIVDHDSRPECRSSFEAEIETGVLGNLKLVQFCNSPMRVSHTQHHVAYAASDHLIVCRQLSGMLFLEQETRALSLKPGDLTLLDPLLPYEGTFSHDSKTLILKVPVGNWKRASVRRETWSRVWLSPSEWKTA